MYRPITMGLMVCGFAIVSLASGFHPADTSVSLIRVPNQGLQPQVAVDGKGVVHLIYFKGNPAAGDIFYVRSTDGGVTFSAPACVNSQPGSAIATGNIRGAHMAMGRNGRVHVAWNGSDRAQPKVGAKGLPMLYTRSNDSGASFEAQRNVITKAIGLDGGGSVAADEASNVYVVWHAPEPGKSGEENRRVWISRSDDEGKTFAPESPIDAKGSGVCGCCGLRAGAVGDDVFILYRTATERANRDSYLLSSKDHGVSFLGALLHPWNIKMCPMSSFGFCPMKQCALITWESDGQVYFARVDAKSGQRTEAVAAPGSSKGRKHAVATANNKGETILVWTEGMGWQRGGAVAWQVFDSAGKPTDQRGRSDGVPAWSLVATFAKSNGEFVVAY